MVIFGQLVDIGMTIGLINGSTQVCLCFRTVMSIRNVLIELCQKLIFSVSVW